jgi:uncharacterized protein (DUF433 family)
MHVRNNRFRLALRKGERHTHAVLLLFSREATLKTNLLDRITIEPGKCGGRPCIRGMRIRVNDILEMLGDGIDMSEILADFPDLERDDILACLQFAARRSDIVRLAA